jgi:hypothetical protein
MAPFVVYILNLRETTFQPVLWSSGAYIRSIAT